MRFSEGSDTCSTIIRFLADVQVVLRVSMSIRFTRLRSNVCWAKPNHAFFYCQQFRAIFFQAPRVATAPIAAIGSARTATAAAANPAANLPRKQKQR
ncbi:hypothetical protein FZ025_15335 [Xanthomonas hyacinthi]|nr:hypothetical protein FZ025_15335 [Xanthomonas hyacinthi]